MIRQGLRATLTSGWLSNAFKGLKKGAEVVLLLLKQVAWYLNFFLIVVANNMKKDKLHIRQEIFVRAWGEDEVVHKEC